MQCASGTSTPRAATPHFAPFIQLRGVLMLRCRFAHTAIALAIASIALPASAQGTAEQPTQTVTISASRTKTSVADIPASLTVLDGAQLDKQMGVSTDALDALGKFVPGLETNNEMSFDNSGKGPQMRGRAASVLVNGVAVNTLLRSSGFTMGLIDSYAIDRIEVNRGATAAFGFGAPGGLISVQTRRGQSA
ncbi:MAG TPA: TonB-dependent receptor plug domain-containing protein [Rubrivivax sp.]|nr:TonB-dependent receptor plug domain-containing protein [Rubrivivax sp.]